MTIIDILQFDFFQNALVVGVLASVAAGVMGSLIVLKKISFITGSIAHASFGGLGMAYFFGVNPLLGAMIFSVLSALGIGVVSDRAKQREDALIGAMWSIGMAVGLIFVALTPGYAVDLFSYLFGNILLTTRQDIWLVLILDGIVVVSVALFFKYFLAIIFDEQFSRLTNVPVLAIYLFFLALVALTVVILIKLVGIILVIALLTLPAATANLLSKTLRGIMVWSVVLSVLATVGGIFVSYFLDWPTGPVIVFVAAIIFILVLTTKKFRYFWQ